MGQVPWLFLVPFGVNLLVAVFLCTDVETSHPENVSTAKLRAMNIAFGLLFVYGGFLIWFFDIETWRLRLPWNRPFGIGLMCFGIIYTVAVCFMSRVGLVRDSQVHTKSMWDQDFSGEADISPSERVSKVRSPN